MSSPAPLAPSPDGDWHAPSSPVEPEVEGAAKDSLVARLRFDDASGGVAIDAFDAHTRPLDLFLTLAGDADPPAAPTASPTTPTVNPGV